MMKLQRCNFCSNILKMEEIGLKDKDLGILCKSCFTWLNTDFLPKLRGEYKCQ